MKQIVAVINLDDIKNTVKVLMKSANEMYLAHYRMITPTTLRDLLLPIGDMIWNATEESDEKQWKQIHAMKSIIAEYDAILLSDPELKGFTVIGTVYDAVEAALTLSDFIEKAEEVSK